MTRSFRYYDLILGAFVAVLLCSNLIGPAKVVQLDLPFFGPTDFGAGNLFFPLSYIFGDILTEVYGYALARRVIWSGFAAMLFATVMTWVVLAMPASPNEPFSAQLQPRSRPASAAAGASPSVRSSPSASAISLTPTCSRR